LGARVRRRDREARALGGSQNRERRRVGGEKEEEEVDLAAVEGRGEARVSGGLDGEGIKGRSRLVVRCDVDRERVTPPAWSVGEEDKGRSALLRVTVQED
jgi:hypothetical protein